MFIINIIIVLIIIWLGFVIFSFKNELETEITINSSITERQELLTKENENLRRENKLLQEELDKVKTLPKVEKVSKPRGRKPKINK